MLPTHAKRLAMARGEHVMSNDELLEREAAEARRAEAGWQDPAVITNNPITNTDPTSLGKTQEVEEQTKPKMSARPSIKKLFSRNSMQSAKRHSGISTPRNEQSLEFEAGQEYAGLKAGKEPELVGQGQMERSSSYVRRLQQQQQGQQQQQEAMPRGAVREQMSRQGSAYTGRSERLKTQELEEWPLPSPGRSQVLLGQAQGPSESEMLQQEMLQNGNGSGAIGDVRATRGNGHAQDVGMREKPKVTRVPDVPSAGMGKEGKGINDSQKKKEKKEGGCGGCCIVM